VLDAVISLRDVSAGYGKLQVLSGVSVEAMPGEIAVIVGPNGSGKSTVLRTIAGLTTVYKGTVELDGAGVVGVPPHRLAKLGLAYLPQTQNVFTDLTVAENLRMAEFTVEKHLRKERLHEVAALFPQLDAYQESRAGQLSGGERQMLAMAMALVRKPKVMLFDEPTGNLSPKIAMQVLGMIRSLAERGITILLVEQNAKKALEIGSKAYLLANGKVVFSGTCKELLEHKELGRLYLGLQTS
jgi:branched-chain amino acid transport system ATP-binding protein